MGDSVSSSGATNIGSNLNTDGITEQVDETTSNVEGQLGDYDMSETQSMMDQTRALMSQNVAVQMEMSLMSYEQSMYTSIEQKIQWK